MRVFVIVIFLVFGCSRAFPGDIVVLDAHPRLFFNGDDVVELQQRTNTTHISQWQVLEGFLQEFLSFNYSAAPETWVIEDVRAFAFGYAVDGSVAYRDKAVEIMNLMVGWSIPDDDGPNRERLISLALAFDWTHNGLTTIEKSVIASRIDDYMAWVSNEFNSSTNWFQGHGRFGMISLCIGALATEGDLANAEGYLTQSSGPLIQHVLPIWERFGSTDGGTYYGADYGGITLFDTLFFVEAWRTATGEDLVKDSEFWPRSFDYRVALARPNLTMARVDDCWDARASAHDKCVANWVASKFREPVAQWFAVRIDANDPIGNGLARWRQWWEILWQDPTVLPAAPAWTAKHFVDIGDVSLRTDWGDDATIVRFLCGDYGGAHDHQHQNSFSIYHRGELAIDSGGFDGVGSAHSDGYYQRTIAHNTITVFNPSEDFAGEINDGGQRFIRREFGGPFDLAQFDANHAQYETGDVLRFSTEREVDYVMGDASAAYRSDKVENFTRQLLFFKPNVVLVYDRVAVANPAWEVNWHLHGLDPPSIIDSTATFSVGDSLLTSQTLLPEEVTLTSAPAFDVYGITIPPSGSNWTYDEGEGRLDVSPSSANTQHRFLHLLAVGDNVAPPDTIGRHIQSTEGNAHGVRFLDRSVWFAESETKDSIWIKSFSTSGLQGESKHLVCDVKPKGMYVIQLNGETQLTAIANDSGLLQFDSRVRLGQQLSVVLCEPDDSRIVCKRDVPTTSIWSMSVLGLGLLAVGTMIARRQAKNAEILQTSHLMARYRLEFGVTSELVEHCD